MRKSMIVLALVAIALFVAAPAWALQVHGGWNTSTEGCADCHTTHAADAAYLLAAGPTQKDACYACHGQGATASPYDVKNGAITSDFDYERTPRAVWGGATTRPSYAGGFVKSYNFEVDADAAGPVDGSYVASDSVHNVENVILGESGGAWNSASAIPGGQAAIPNNVFKCGSCHDPHGVNNGTNPRLLRQTLPAIGSLAVTITTDAVYRPTAYNSNVNNWCGGCHNYFNAADGSGHSSAVGTAGTQGYNPNSKYRHPMGIAVVTTTAFKGAGYYLDASQNAMAKGTPVSSDGSKLMCFSCHRAHGTVSGNDSAISNEWNRYTDSGGAKTGRGSALLRLKNRDTCYNCHGGAQQNLYNSGT